MKFIHEKQCNKFLSDNILMGFYPKRVGNK